eukprot:TRINITY_DN1382_c0_g1_i1.p1 TRINITY_DN1382_c0_g1~~TRINITY_DN1382_c0_g1_i1.p1  ORF type:complete len:567 (-),score=178.14 TRINITY_DN1382_c0_g1_i1:388-2088(-)
MGDASRRKGSAPPAGGFDASALQSTIFAQPSGPGVERVAAAMEMTEVITTVPGLESTDVGETDPEALMRQLYLAVRMGHAQAAGQVIEKLKNRNALDLLKEPDHDGHSLMHWAAKSGDVQLMELLLLAGSPLAVPSQDPVGMYPMHWTCTEGHLKALKWLRSRGADVDCRDRQGCTPVVIAAQYGFVELVIYLIKAGARADILDENADSPLHWAAYKGHTPVMVMLLNLGHDVDARDAHGQSPLHLAALRGHLDAVEYLVLEANADTQAKDKYEKTPLDLAVKKHMVDVEWFLRTQSAGGAAKPAMLLECLRRPALIKTMCAMGQGAQGALWPYILNVGSSSFVGGAMVTRFFDPRFLYTPFAASIVTAAFTAYVMMWVFLGAVRFSDPGFISAQQEPALSANFKKRMETLLEEEAGEGQGPEGLPTGPLCYTCSLERPIRAKHCRVCRRCVRCFDHHCAFVRNCIGLRNYSYFYLYLVFFLAATVTHVTAGALWLWRLGFDWLVAVSTVYTILYVVMGIGLVQYHTQLISRNLTTNEHQASTSKYWGSAMQNKDRQQLSNTALSF